MAQLPLLDFGINNKVSAISTTALHSCVLLDDASTKCWGWNDRGNLGYGDTRYRGMECQLLSSNILSLVS